MLGAEMEEGPERKGGKAFDGTVQPGEAMTVAFRTTQDDRAAVRAEAAAGPLLWRVQLRRGLVPLRDTEVSATAVIGVEFAPRAIGSEQGEVAHRPAARARLSPLVGQLRSANTSILTAELRFFRGKYQDSKSSIVTPNARLIIKSIQRSISPTRAAPAGLPGS
jgi:hypothetical protein